MLGFFTVETCENEGGHDWQIQASGRGLGLQAKGHLQPVGPPEAGHLQLQLRPLPSSKRLLRSWQVRCQGWAIAVKCDGPLCVVHARRVAHACVLGCTFEGQTDAMAPSSCIQIGIQDTWMLHVEHCMARFANGRWLLEGFPQPNRWPATEHLTCTLPGTQRGQIRKL